VQIEITGCLRHRNATIPHQPHCLKLELAAELSSLHSHSPVPSTPYLGVHETGSRPDKELVAFLKTLEYENELPVQETD